MVVEWLIRDLAVPLNDFLSAFISLPVSLLLQQQPDLWQSGVECQLLRRGVHPVGAAEISCGGHLLCTLLLGPELLASWQLLLKATKNDTST
jgi:hypothetical protein